jgi:DNA-binding SARP family transcriptional activator
MIQCRVLGPVEITVNGHPAPPQLTWRKHIAMLIYLGRSPRLRRSRDHLVGLLWPEKGETAARHSLNEAIRVIRRVAGDEALVSEAGQIRLAPSILALDVDRLTGLASAGDWAAAAELVTGEFLEDFSIPEASQFEDWLTAERQQWKRTSREILLQRGEELLARGAAEAAVAMAERARRIDFTAESAVALAMRAQALSGNPARAVDHYEEFVTRLKADTGSEPGVELRALARRIREAPTRRPAPPRGQEQPDPRTPPLIGRERELGELLAVWRNCRDAGAGAAVVQGDAGLGKSRLVDELLLRAGLDGASVARARAVESDRDDAWTGFRALVRGGLIDFPGAAGAPVEAHAGMARLAGEWRERFPPGNGDGALPFAQALTEILRVSSEERPVLLVLDDAEWLDRESLQSVPAVLRDLTKSPLLIVVASAPEPPRPELESLAGKIGRDTRGGVIQLKPLEEEDLTALARWWLPRYSGEEIDRVVRRVAADSAGVPLRAVELFRAVALGMDLPKTGAWPQPTRTLDQTLPSEIPPSVVAAIRVTFRRLSRDGQAVLSTASALPEPVSADRLARATGLPLHRVNPSLDELEWQRWLVAESRGYTFVARLVRTIIARDLLTEGQRRRIRTP